jgi:hypothetical protein
MDSAVGISRHYDLLMDQTNFIKSPAGSSVKCFLLGIVAQLLRFSEMMLRLSELSLAL